MEPSQYAPPPPASSSSGGATAAPAGRPRGRIGLIVLTALLTEIVLIAAGANQWAAKQMGKSHGQVRYYLAGWLTYAWRVTAPHGEKKLWAAQLALIGTVLVLTAVLVWCLLRGPVTWGRAFFGTWLAVLFATVAGAIVRGFVEPFAPVHGNSRVTAALFGFDGPTAPAVFGGLALGLVVAVITSVIAVVSRRAAAETAAAESGPPQFADYGPPAASAPAQLPPWQDQHFAPHAGGPSYPPPPPGAGPVGPPAASGPPPAVDGDAATTAMPRSGAEQQQTEQLRRDQPAPDEATTQMPVVPPAEPAQPAQAAQAAQPTQAAQSAPDAQPTQASDQPAPEQPRVEQPATDQPTTQMPVVPPGQPPEQATTRFPRPPDDEELGHIDH